MRRMIGFDCEGARLCGTLDMADGSTGLLIVSGGNEIRSGAHAGQAAMAAHFAALDFPVFRYDRRGIGESEGENGGFITSGPDIAAAVAAFRHEAPSLSRIIAFGNCDAASALALFADGIDSLILANPWVIEAAGDDAPTPPSAAAVRARYWARIKNPRSLLDLFSGKIDLKKLRQGLARAAQKDAPTGLAHRVAGALAASTTPTHILIAERDVTAMTFMAAWRDAGFTAARARIDLQSFPTASHSFADAGAQAWLLARIEHCLRS
jgi:exosortase A-associated hydrolase 1